jgi:hypothetical protein
MALFVLLWAIEDVRRRRQQPCFDFGFFLTLAFPVSIVWYAFWSRGVRGFLVLAILVGLYLAPWVCMSLAWILAYALHRG